MKCKRLLLLLLLAIGLPWVANAQETLTVYEETNTTNYYAPMFVYYFDDFTKAQTVFPAEDLEDMTGGTITAITFYTNSSNIPYTTVSSADIYLTEVENATISAYIDKSSATMVKTGYFDFVSDGNGGGMVTITFTTPYQYNGGNLLFGCDNTEDTDYKQIYFKGISATGASISGYNSSSTGTISTNSRNFLPKTTFTYDPASSTATAPGVTTNNTPTDLTNVSVTLGGTITDMGGAAGVYAGICYSTSPTPTTSDGHAHSRYTAAGAYTQDITGLLPNTTYYYRAYAYNSANSVDDPTYGDIYSFTTGGTITLDQPANGEISVSVAGGTATTSNTYALPNQIVTLTATAVSGYSFDNWIVSGVTGTASGSSYTFTMPTNNVTVTASIVPTSGGTSTGIDWNLWERATTISTDEIYLIGAVSGSDVYLVLNYAPNQSNHYYYSSSNNYWAYTAKATLDENGRVTGCTGNATDLQYAQWKFSSTTGGTITSLYDSNRYLYGTTSSSWTDLYPNTSSTTWTYSNDQLSYSSSNYLYLNTSYYIQKGTSASTVYLYKPAIVTTYAITATASPAEGGTVSGSDYYLSDASCTLTATPAFGYDFVSWTENGTVVSTDAEYTFTVSSARTLVANFESQGSCIKPTDVAQVANTQAAHQAQLSWTENSGATQWQVVYSTDSEFDADAATPITVNENPATITGLSQETTYYVRVRAICGENSQSGWSNQATFSTISGHLAPTVSYDESTLTDNGVTVTWTGVATNTLHQSYDLYYSTSSVMPDPLDQSTLISGITGNSRPLTDLISNTQYYVWVRDNCGTDGTSDWSTSTNFTTECGIITIDATHRYWEEGFESYNVGTSTSSGATVTDIKCWERVVVNNSTSSPFVYRNYQSAASTGLASLELKTSSSSAVMVALPEFSEAIDNLNVAFNYNCSNATYTYTAELGYISNVADANTFVKLFDIPTPVARGSHSTFSQDLYEAAASANAPTGSRVAIKFATTTYNTPSWNFDDFVVSYVSPCRKPQGLAVAEGYPTAHEVSFTWNFEEGEVFQFALPVGNVTEPEQVTWNTTWYAGEEFPSWDALQADTDRTFWLRKKCGDTEFSDPVYITFHTLEACPAPTSFVASDVTNHTAKLSWDGTSDSYVVSVGTYTLNTLLEEGFESGSMPTGWSHLGQGTAAPTTYSSTSEHHHNGDYVLKFNGTTDYNLAVLPAFDVPTNTLTIDFWTKAESSSSSGTFEFGYVTDATDASTFKTLETYEDEETVSAYLHVEDYSLASVPATARLAFRHKSASSSWYWFVDDVTVYRAENINWVKTETTTDETYTFVGLDPETNYIAKVQGDCDTEGFSREVTTYFTTDLPCPDPTNLQVVENSVKSDRVTLSWDSDYAEEWTVAYKAEDDADFTETTAPVNPYTLEGLTEETTYTVKVRSNCGSADGLSTGWSNEVTFTTTEACVVMDVAVGDVTHHAATVTWTGDNKDEDNPGFTVSYRTTQQIDGVEESFDGSSIPSGWTLYLGKVDDVVAGTATLNSSTSYAWKIATASTNVFNSNHAKLNIYGASVNSWLVSPEMSLPSNGAVSFDLALTAYDYSGGSTSAASGTCADDRFAFLVYANDAWHILREWNNAEGTTYVYNNIATTGEHVNIDLSAYNGQTVKIAFYGESTVNGNGDNDLHIDNVVIGTPIAAGEWHDMTVANDASSANLSGLTAGTRYDVKVAPNCDATFETEIVQFTTVSEDEKWFIAEGNWGTASNWEPVGAPTINQNVTLMANATIESTCVAEAKSINGTGTGTDAYTLTIKDGGKLKHLNSGVRATVEKAIRAYSTNYDADTYNNGDYYLIANPLTSAVTPSEANGFFAGNYDLYSWDYAQDLEWRNNVTSLMYGSYGYLYANEAGTTLTYTGTINAYTSYKYRTCDVASNPDGYNFPSWYLLGNPYLYDAYLANASSNGNALPYIKMNANGDGFENVAAGEPIPPMEGFFYQAVSGATSTYVVTTAPAVQSNSKLNMNLRRNNKQLDNAILVFGGDQQLGKMTFRPNSSKVFMPVEGKDYAITSVEGQVGEVPVSFVPENNGTYSLSFTSEDVTFSYLHLIDNMTGTDVNLLETPSYTFDARTTDYESRFKLVFAVGSSATDDTFGFVNASGNFCIFGIEGEATVQVIDVLGHVLSSETFSGSYEKRINGAPGVYMVRLIQGNDVKVQKVVVRR